MTKQCRICGEIKPITEFNKTYKWYSNRCKSCQAIYMKKWCDDNKDKRKAQEAERYLNNKQKHAEKCHAYYVLNKEKIKAKASEYRLKNKETLAQKAKERRLSKEHKEKWYREYKSNRYKEDSRFRLNHNISAGIRTSLRGKKEGRKWEELVGYTLDQLKKHIERQFQPGMSWNNYGEWHIDHEIPISAFNFSTFQDLDFQRCWALKNLRPLWKETNLKKHAKLSRPFQPSLQLNLKEAK